MPELVAMTISNMLTILGLLVLVGFIVFAFRQGTRVKTRNSAQDGEIPGGGYDTAASGWTTHIDGGGGHGGADSGGGH